MKIICEDRRSRIAPTGPSTRSINSVTADVDQLLGPKSLEQLNNLEVQISNKLQSDEPIDVEYWEQLLQNIRVYKAKAELKKLYKAIIASRLQVQKEQQIAEAGIVQVKLAMLSQRTSSNNTDISTVEITETSMAKPVSCIVYSEALDPEPFLKIRPDDKGLEVMEESDFLDKIVSVAYYFRRIVLAADKYERY